MSEGIVYMISNDWIKNPVTGERPYKIGMTKKNVAERSYGLEIKIPGAFEVLVAYKLENYAKAEKALHTIFNQYRINGEWFMLQQKEIDHFKTNCETMGGVDITKEVSEEIKIVTENSSFDENSDTTDKGGEIELLPNREIFRKELLLHKKANWIITYDDGKTESGNWDASNMTETSSIIGNIRSGYLRDWRKKGIVKAVFEAVKE